jgi:hypothetical protein
VGVGVPEAGLWNTSTKLRDRPIIGNEEDVDFVNCFGARACCLRSTNGVTGKKVDYRSVPYVNITMFSKESAGMLDLDAELKLWIRGSPEPLQFSFTKDARINDVYRVLSDHILK